MAVVSDGFEVGDADLSGGDGAFWASGGKGGTGTIVGNATDIVDSGTYSAKVEWAADADYARCNHTLADSTTNYAQFRIYVASFTEAHNGGGFCQVHALRNGSYQGARINLCRSTSTSTYYTTLLFRRDGADVTLTGATVLNAGGWHTIEVYYKNDATVGGAQWWIDGVSEGSDFTRDTDFLNSHPTTLTIGQSYGKDAGVIYFDNVKHDAAYIGIAAAWAQKVIMVM